MKYSTGSIEFNFSLKRFQLFSDHIISKKKSTWLLLYLDKTKMNSCFGVTFFHENNIWITSLDVRKSSKIFMELFT